VASCQGGVLPINFSVSENFLFVRKFLFKNTNLGLKDSHLGKFKGTIEIFV